MAFRDGCAADIINFHRTSPCVPTRRPSAMDDGIFSAAALTRLPLADAVWRLLHFTMDDAWLDDLWTRKRGRCYENLFKFSTLAHLVANALLEHGGSGHQAFKRAKEAEALPVSIGSTYEKLGNLPLAVSEALLDEGTQRMASDPCPRPRPWTRCRTAGRVTKSSVPTARRSSTSNGCSSRCAACRRASWGRGPRWAWTCGPAWPSPWSVISMARPARPTSPRSCCAKLAAAAGGKSGWWCWTASTAT